MKFDPMVKIELEVIVAEIRSLNQKVAKLEKPSPTRAASWKGIRI